MKTSLAERLDVYLGAAALAAHASFAQDGFRVRDVGFFSDLFLNWCEEFDPTPSAFQRTQLSRYVELLVRSGYARRSKRERTTLFRLTRLGLLELLNRLTDTRVPLSPAQTLFRLCFLKSYRPWLHRLVESEGSSFPPALATELTALLDIDSLLTHEIKRIERALSRLEKRINDALKTSSLTTNRLATGVPFPEIVKEVESRYPYELNSMKPLHELIASIAPDQRCWELQQGNILRVSIMWEPQRMLLRETLKQLRAIQGWNQKQ